MFNFSFKLSVSEISNKQSKLILHYKEGVPIEFKVNVILKMSILRSTSTYLIRQAATNQPSYNHVGPNSNNNGPPPSKLDTNTPKWQEPTDTASEEDTRD